MKKIRRTKIRFQTNELLIVRRDGAQNNPAAEPEPLVPICPLCRSPLLPAPAKEFSDAVAGDADLPSESDERQKMKTQAD